MEQHRPADLDVYGSDCSGWSDSSADDDELPPAKRTRESAAASSSSSTAKEAESENDDSQASSASGYGDADRGYISAKICDLQKLGCSCTRKNHHLAIPANNMEELMYSLEKGKKRDKNIFCMGKLSAGLREPATGASQRNFVCRVLRHEVSRQAFSEIYSLSHQSLQSLQEFVEAGRIAPPSHKLSGCPASRAISAGLKADTITFIRNYGTSYGMPQPAAPRGARNTPPTYLPASLTVLLLFQTFQTAKSDASISYCIFRKILPESAADIKIMKSRSDVCDKCDKVGDRMRIAKTEDQLASVTQGLESHLKVARMNPSFTMTSSVLLKIAWRILLVKSPLHHPLPT